MDSLKWKPVAYITHNASRPKTLQQQSKVVFVSPLKHKRLPTTEQQPPVLKHEASVELSKSVRF